MEITQSSPSHEPLPPHFDPAATINNILADQAQVGADLATTDDYKVTLPVFEGPLDLLLHLIRKDQLNIYDIPIAKICKRYLEHLELMCQPDVNVAGEFFVMAATLTYLKSQVLLPVEQQEMTDEDPRLPLVQQLLEYERFKLAAQKFDEMHWLHRDVFPRPANAANDIPVESLLDAPIEPVDAYKLLVNFKVALNRTTRPPIQISADTISIRAKVHSIGQFLTEKSVIDFQMLIPPAYKTMDVIVSFLAILELAKLKYVEIIQTETYGPIQIRGVKTLDQLDYALLDQF
jgi:segregation and condensation protein A